MYVILDGFDLGIGILFPFARNESERDQMMRSVAPFWDGNETWLVLGGGGLLVAFPRAYAVIMPALYLPVIVMLLALVFRGVAFEFRTVSHSKTWLERRLHRRLDARGFRAGRHPRRADPGHPGARRRLCRRLVRLGDAVRLPVRAVVVAGYALLGATWLMMKTEGAVAVRARAPSEVAAAGGARLHGGGEPVDAAREPRIAAALVLAAEFLFPVAGAGGDRAHRVLAAGAGSRAGREAPPFLATIALFLLGFLGLVISNFPYLVPPSLTIWDTAAAPASQIFMLLGTLLLLPIDPRLHRLHLLAVPRQGARGRKLSLTRQREAPARALAGRSIAQPSRISGNSPAPRAETSAALPAPYRGIAP